MSPPVRKKIRCQRCKLVKPAVCFAQVKSAMMTGFTRILRLFSGNECKLRQYFDAEARLRDCAFNFTCAFLILAIVARCFG